MRAGRLSWIGAAVLAASVAGRAAGDESPLDLRPRFGPAEVPLGHDLTLALPPDFLLFDAPQARQLAERAGRVVDDSLLGAVAFQGGERGRQPQWYVEISYTEMGRVDDTAAVDPNQIIDMLRARVERASAAGQRPDGGAVRVEGWLEAPHYRRPTRTLWWAVTAASPDRRIADAGACILGRRGVVSLQLVATAEQFAAARPEVAKLVASTGFDEGARYEDFRPGDPVAAATVSSLVAASLGAPVHERVGVATPGARGGLALALLVAFVLAIAVVSIRRRAARRRRVT